jgi:hypothetical protein
LTGGARPERVGDVRRHHACFARWPCTGATLLAIIAGPLVLPTAVPWPAAAEPAAAAKQPPRAKVYRTPGYRGLKRVPRTGPEPAPPVVSLGAGERPDVLVDAAGTAHVVFNESVPAGGSDVTHYCRLPRGAKACNNPSATPFPPIADAFSADFAGPKILQIGDGLVALSLRYPAVVTHPDGATSDRTLYAWVSTDGGESWTGPAIIGTVEPSGDAAVVGGRLAVITDTVTGGTSAQIYSSGAYQRGGVLLGPGDAAYGGTIADDGGVPIAAFNDLAAQVIVRRFGGAGDVRDPATWSATSFPGARPRLATGPRGAWVLYREDLIGPWAIRPVPGGQPGPGQRLSPPSASENDEGDLVQDAGGRLRALWATGVSPTRVVARTSEPVTGSSFGGEELFAAAEGVAGLRAATTDDGGGGAVFQRTQGAAKDVVLAAFGPLSPTGKPGAGSRAGEGIPGAVAGCTLVKFAAVQIRPRGGCLLPSVDPAFRGASVSEAEIDLNGLAIVPEANVKIVIDPRRRRLDTTGDVRVILRGGGLPDLTIFRGELHVDFQVTGADTGKTIFDFDATGLDLGGFPIGGRIAVRLAADGVRIPLSLRLPPSLGGISGEATLAARLGSGVTVESARIRAALVPIGPIAIEDLDIAYAADEWNGKATLALPPRPGGAKLGAAVRFRGGKFRGGRLELTLPGLGIPIAPNIYFLSARGGFDAEPITFSVGASIGAYPITPTPPTFTAKLDGDLTMRIRQDVEFELDVTLKVLDITVSDAHGLLTTGGYGELTAQFGADLGVLEVAATGTFAFDGPAGRFASEFAGSVSIADQKVTGGAGTLSNAGVAACGNLVTGSLGVWIPARGRPEVFGDPLSGCELGPYRGQPVARPRQAGSPASFVVPAGAKSASVEVTGAGAPPTVVLTAPDGQAITPGPPAAGATSFAVPVGQTGQTIVAIRSPAAGTWTVQAAPGSPALAGVRVALPRTPVAVKATLRGRGRSRTLSYSASGLAEGATVRVFERGAGVARPVGVIRRASGTLRLRAGEGRRGPRTVVGYVERPGLPQRPLVLTRYIAPGVASPPRVRGARAALRRGRLTVAWRRAPGAEGYQVQVRLNDGRVIVRVLPRSARSLRVAGLGARARLRSANVRSRMRDGRIGPAATARR